jgi:predicted metal-dependent hydrolase
MDEDYFLERLRALREEMKDDREKLRKELSADLKGVQNKLYSHMKDTARLKAESKYLLEQAARIEQRLTNLQLQQASRRRKESSPE